MAVACDAGRSEAATLDGGQHVLHGGVGQHVEDGDDADAGNESDGNVALGMVHFPAHHVQVVPSVVGPERGDQRGEEAGNAAGRAGELGGEVAPGSARGGEAKNGDGDDHRDLQHGEEELEFAGLLHAEVVQSGDERGGKDGDELAVGDGEAATRSQAD